MQEAFDPYRKWLGIPPEEQPPHGYRLLGIGLFERDPDVISNAADRQMAHVRTFHNGRYKAQSQRILNELSAARVCLLDTQRKAEYDAQLRGLGYLDANDAAEAAIPPQASYYDATSYAPPPTDPFAPTGPTFPDLPRASSQVAATPAYDLTGLHERDSHVHAASYYRRRSQSSGTWLMAGICGGLLVAALAVVVAMNAGRPDPVTKRPPDPPSPIDKPVLPKPADGGTKVPTPTPPKPTPEPIPKIDLPKVDPPKTDPPEPAIDPTPTVKPPVNPPPLSISPTLPDAAALRPLIGELKPAINEDIAKAKDRPERQAVIKKLILQASEVKADHLRHYFLLKEARDLAVKIGDADAFLNVIDILNTTFEFDPWELKSLAFYEACGVTTKGEEFLGLLPLYEKFMNQAAATERYDVAVRAARTAVSTANKYRATTAAKRMEAFGTQFEAAERERKQAETAMQMLAEKPDDPQANQQRGGYLCFTRADWRAGLPYLAKGADAEVRKAAELDAAAPTAADQQAELGQLWLTLGKKHGGQRRTEILKRAQHWYNLALPNLTDRTEAELRVVEIGRLLGG